MEQRLWEETHTAVHAEQGTTRNLLIAQLPADIADQVADSAGLLNALEDIDLLSSELVEGRKQEAKDGVGTSGPSRLQIIQTVEQILEDPESSFKLLTVVEHRIRRYGELLTQLEGVNVEQIQLDIARNEEIGNPEDLYDRIGRTQSAESALRGDEIAEKIRNLLADVEAHSASEADIKTQLQNIGFQLSDEELLEAVNNPAYLKNVLNQKYDAVRELHKMQVNDSLGAERPEFNQEAIRDEWKNGLALREFIDDRISKRARELEKRFQSMIENDVSKMNLTGNMTEEQLRTMVATIGNRIQRAHRYSGASGLDVSSADPYMRSVTDTEYRRYAMAVSDDLDEIEHACSSPDRLEVYLTREAAFSAENIDGDDPIDFVEDRDEWVDATERRQMVLDRRMQRGEQLMQERERKNREHMIWLNSRETELTVLYEVFKDKARNPSLRSIIEKTLPPTDAFFAPFYAPEGNDMVNYQAWISGIGHLIKEDATIRERVDTILTITVRPELAERMSLATDEQKRAEIEARLPDSAEELAQRVNSVQKSFETLRYLRDSSIDKTSGLYGLIAAKCDKLRKNINEDPVQVQIEIEDMHRALTMLQDENLVVKPEQEFIDDHGPCVATYKPKGDVLYVNQDAYEGGGQTAYDRWMIDHERGHRIVNILARKTGVLPQLLTDIRRGFTHNEQGHVRTVTVALEDENRQMDMYELLEHVVITEWGEKAIKDEYINDQIEAGHDEHAKEIVKEKYYQSLMEEALNMFASYRTYKIGGDDLGRVWNLKPGEEILFFELAKIHATPEDREKMKDATGEMSDEMQFNLGNINWDMSDHDDINDEMQMKGGEFLAGSESMDYNQEIIGIERVLRNLEAFKESFPDAYSGSFKKWTEGGGGVKGLRPWLTEVKQKLDRDDSYQADREINEMNKVAGILKSSMDSYKAAALDLTNAQKDGKLSGLFGFTNSIGFYSINDYIETFKQFGEDLKRLWDRRHNAARADLGAGMTGWVPEWVPYLGRLANEAGRRANKVELDEVNQFKEAYGDKDSEELLGILRRSQNKDELRACFELLADNGRIDWNDEAMWRNLSALSSFRMNIEACRHDDVMRDEWLHKIIYDIWGDQDHFKKWRSGNDSNINSKMKSFTPRVNQLSNNGGMGTKLESMLSQYRRYKDAGLPLPESVDPHYYEEILDFAIRNGKMSMQQKFFYLIQGVHHGILSIDRLRNMAGDKDNAILLIFPYIDYFYQKNNTKADIDRLAERLTESDNPYAPGIKTTLFLQFEINREQSVKERLEKGAARVAEKMDHDDMHFFLSNMDLNMMEMMLSAYSGKRQRVTPPGLMNGYIGFNEKMQAYAVLAKLHEDGMKHFSSADAKDVVSTLVSYVHFDNILSRNGNDDNGRPKLSKEAFYNKIPVVGDQIVGNYRERMNGFAQEVLGEYLNDGDWADINTKIGGAGDTAVSGDSYADNEPYKYNNSEDLKKNNFKASEHVLEKMMEKAVQNPEIIRRWLIRFAGLDSQAASGRLPRGKRFLSGNGDEPHSMHSMAAVLAEQEAQSWGYRAAA